jgi:transcriptional regulator with XRE-family HTH domain
MSLLSSDSTTALRALGDRARLVRLARGWSQQEFASRAGMPLPTYRLFERTGAVSTRGLWRLLVALGRRAELDTLFAHRPSSLHEVVGAAPTRRRGRTG